MKKITPDQRGAFPGARLLLNFRQRAGFVFQTKQDFRLFFKKNIFSKNKSPQIREGLFRGARLLLNFRQGVGEGDDKLAVSLPLVLGECEDAGEVVVVR